MNNSSVSYTSHHYFIGKRLKKSDAMKIRQVQTDILQKNNLDMNAKVGNIYTPFLYLGYFDEKVEQKVKDLLLPQFFAIAEKIGPMECHIKNYTYAGQSNKFQYLALSYHTPDNVLEKVVVPYLKSYMDSYTNMDLTYEDIPMVPLFRLNSENMLQFSNKNPSNTDNNGRVKFNKIAKPDLKYIDIDTIDLLRATPVNVKKGKKSFNEQLQIDVLMSIPLGGSFNQ